MNRKPLINRSVKQDNLMAENKNIQMEFQIKGIFVSEFNVKICEEFIKADNELNGSFSNYTFEVSCINNAIVPESLVDIKVIVKVFLDEGKKILLGNLVLSNLFWVNNLVSFVNKETKTYSLPEQFEASLIGISLSHSRAILLAKCAGTFLQNAVLPIMNPNAFIKKTK